MLSQGHSECFIISIVSGSSLIWVFSFFQCQREIFRSINPVSVPSVKVQSFIVINSSAYYGCIWLTTILSMYLLISRKQLFHLKIIVSLEQSENNPPWLKVSEKSVSVDISHWKNIGRGLQDYNGTNDPHCYHQKVTDTGKQANEFTPAGCLLRQGCLPNWVRLFTFLKLITSRRVVPSNVKHPLNGPLSVRQRLLSRSSFMKCVNPLSMEPLNLMARIWKSLNRMRPQVGQSRDNFGRGVPIPRQQQLKLCVRDDGDGPAPRIC